MKHWLVIGFNYKSIKLDHLVPFLHLTYLLPIAWVDDSKGFSTYWIVPFVVDENLQEKSQSSLYKKNEVP